MELINLTISEIRDALTSKRASAEELVRAHLAHIEKRDADVHAYLSLSPERALAQARQIDHKIAAGETLPPLAGVIGCTPFELPLGSVVVAGVVVVVTSVVVAAGVVVVVSELPQALAPTTSAADARQTEASLIILVIPAPLDRWLGSS